MPLDVRDLAFADLVGFDLAGTSLTRSKLHNAYLTFATLTSANLAQSDLTDADLSRTTIAGVDFTGAVAARTDFQDTTSRGFAESQLASTRSYQERELTGIRLSDNDLTDWSFEGQNLFAGIVRMLDGAATRLSTLANRSCLRKGVEMVRRRAFTLTELLVVIFVIAILIALLLPAV